MLLNFSERATKLALVATVKFYNRSNVFTWCGRTIRPQAIYRPSFYYCCMENIFCYTIFTSQPKIV